MVDQTVLAIVGVATGTVAGGLVVARYWQQRRAAQRKSTPTPAPTPTPERQRQPIRPAAKSLGATAPAVVRRAAAAGKAEDEGQARSVLTQVRGYLDADEFGYAVREDEPVLTSAFEGEHGVYNLAIFVHQGVLVVSVRVPVVVPEAHRERMAETVLRANAGLLLGDFKLRYREGQLVFRAGMPIVEGAVSHPQFRMLMGAAMTTADRYYRAFCRLLHGDDLSPAEVIAEVEMSDE